MSDEINKFKKLELVENLRGHEKIFAGIFNFFGYGIGHLGLFNKLSLNGLKTSHKAYRQQSYTYIENNEKIYRRLEARDSLLDSFNGIKSCFEIFLSSVSLNADKPCMGYREPIQENNKIDAYGRKFTQLKLSDFKWLTYSEVLKLIKIISANLRKLGLKKGDKILFFLETCKEWMILALAVMKINGIIVTAYSTLSDENIIYIINLTNPRAVFVDSKTLTRFLALNDSKYINLLIYNKNPLDSTFDIKNIKNYNCREFGELTDQAVEESNSKNLLDDFNSDENDIVLIMFTSGSEGNPKGVKITNKNIVSLMGGVCHRKKYWMKKRYPAYLQLSHILEFCAELAVYSFGSQVGYCRPLTLLASSPGLMEGCKGDLELLKPHTIFTVPLVLERIKKGVMEKIDPQSRIFKLVFQLSYNMRAFYYSKGYDTPILNKLIFKKFKKLLGGSLEYGMIGGSLICPETEQFINVCFGTFKQAYGTTELCCGATFSEINYYRPDNIGPPIGCAEIKLVSWEEAGYSSEASRPSGEIWVHGSNMCDGYYEDQKSNESNFFTDPSTGKTWFKTGDIGEILPDGTFRIIDRKRDLIKLQHGEYISLTKIENVIMGNKYVENCCVLNDPLFSKLIALVVLNRQNIKDLANSFKISYDGNFEILIEDKTFVDGVTKLFDVYLKSVKLQKWEIISKIVFVKDIWTPESGLVTPTMKIKRLEIRKKYEDFLI